MNKDWHPEESDISAYLDGELDQDQRLRISNHLENCPECQKELEGLKIVFNQLANLQDAELERDLSRPVLRALHNQAAAQAKPEGTARAAARPVSRSGVYQWRAGWIVIIQAGLTALLLAVFGAQTWQAWNGWVETTAANRLLPAMLVLQQQLLHSRAAISELIVDQWLAVAQIMKQPLPWNLPSQQAVLIVVASGLVWLIGNRLLIADRGGAYKLQGGSRE